MGQDETKTRRNLYWNDYKDIAHELNNSYPQIDILTLHKSDLKALIVETVHILDKTTRPAPYILDDIRFEWFYLKHGNSCPTGTSKRLSHIF
ncbi:MAG: Fe-S cluster assembly protein IscX [Alphaproteobacteria bacterium]